MFRACPERQGFFKENRKVKKKKYFEPTVHSKRLEGEKKQLREPRLSYIAAVERCQLPVTQRRRHAR
jgi:hypothetical protein